MKKSYFIISLLIVIELILIKISSHLNFKLSSLPLFIQDMIMLIALFPFIFLFFLLSKDHAIKKCFRIFFKFMMWNMIICYIVVTIGLSL